MIIIFFTRNIIFHEPFYEHQQGSTRDALGRTMRSLSPQCSLPADYLGKLCAICAKSIFICQAARRRFQYTNLHIITTREANITRLRDCRRAFESVCSFSLKCGSRNISLDEKRRLKIPVSLWAT